MINAHQLAYNAQIVKQIATTPIFICGAGALGSNVIDNLARHGATALSAIDFDRVEEHNVGTQIYSLEDVGISKTAALRSLIYRNTGSELIIFQQKMTEGNINKFLRQANLVLDTFDNIESRRLVADYCQQKKIACLHLGMDTNTGEVCWNEKYALPENWAVQQRGACDIPLARNIVLLTATVGVQAVWEYLATGQKKSYLLDLPTLQIVSF